MTASTGCVTCTTNAPHVESRGDADRTQILVGDAKQVIGEVVKQIAGEGSGH